MFENIKQLFGGSKTPAPPALTDYSAVAVDLHSHLIPGIDDGSKTMEDTIAMLQGFQALGYKKIITTPHVIRDSYNNSTETLLQGKAEVQKAIEDNHIDIQFDVAAEYYMDETMFERIEKKDFLTMGKNYVLVELSFYEKFSNTTDLIYKLQVAGYRIILAHPERYPYYYEPDFKTFHSFKDRSVYFQINIGSLVGKYGPGAKQTAERMINENLVDFIGSDLHTVKHFEVMRNCLNEKSLQKIVASDKLLNKTLL